MQGRWDITSEPKCRCVGRAVQSMSLFIYSFLSSAAALFLSPRPTHLERTRQIECGGLGRHGPEGAQARGGGGGRPPGGGTGQGGCGEHLGLARCIVYCATSAHSARAWRHGGGCGGRTDIDRRMESGPTLTEIGNM